MSSSLIFSYSPRSVHAQNNPKVSVEVDPADQKYKQEIETYFQNNLLINLEPNALSDLLRRSYFKWPVYNIEVYQDDQIQDAYVVKVFLREIVSDIYIVGQREITRKEIQEAIAVKVGDKVTLGDLPEIETRLKEYYAYRGFPHAEAKVLLNKDPNQQGKILYVEIKEKESCKIGKVFIDENLRHLLHVKPGQRCDAIHILDSTQQLESQLRQDGYLSNSISQPELAYDQDKTKADLELKVELGPKIKVVFLGNTFAFERDSIIKKIISFEDEKEFNASWIESKAKESIKVFYTQLGYPRAEVAVSDAFDAKKNLREISFRIHRGQRFKISRLIFEGNQAFTTERLETEFWGFALSKTSKRVFVEKEISDAADTLLSFYQQHGFLNAQIEPPKVVFSKDRDVDVTLKITENKVSTLKSYAISGNTVFTNVEVEKILGIQPGRAVDPLLIRKNADILEENYKRKGYKFAQIKLPKVEEIGAGEIVYPVEISEGKQIKIASISVSGNLQTKEKVITREVVFGSGDVYQPQKLRETRRKLLQLGFFESVSLDELPVDEKSDSEDVVIRISERKKRSIIFKPGFSTDEGVRAATEFRYVNLFGTGRNFNSYARVNRRLDSGNILERRIVLTYLEPYLVEKFNGKISFIQERVSEQQFDIDRNSFILGLERNVSTWLRTSASWQLEFRNPFNEQPGAVLSPIDQSRARFGSIRTTVDLDRRDDLLNATTGSFHQLDVDIYNKGLLSDADFWQVYMRNNFYYPIYKRLRSVLSVRLGFSSTYGNTNQEGITEIPIEKRFRIGGSSSFRGAGQNCIGGLPSGSAENCSDSILSQAPGGNAMFNYMFEVLIPIFKDFDFAMFTDGGNAYLQNSDFDIFNVRNSAGVGFRFNTFFGPMRFDYGMLLDRRTGENFGTFHFAVGQF